MGAFIDNESSVKFDFPDMENVIRHVIKTVMEDKKIPPDLEVNVLLTVPSSIQRINREIRGIDSVTDVLSFPYFEYKKPGEFSAQIKKKEETILGDIILCASKVKEQAKQYGHSQKRELAFLIVHSMLHLIGYDHMEAEDTSLMQHEEKRFMEKLKIRR